MTEKDKKVIQNIEAEIEKISSKKNRIYFFVIDTKGVPSGSLEYIYRLAYILMADGYDVSMLHTEDEFVGVKDWLDNSFAELPHYNVNSGEVGMSPSDILFIPEIFAQVMNQTKKFPCKRIAILQNYDFVVEQMPYSAQWGDFGIMDAITSTNTQGELLNGVFPYVKVTKIDPYISDIYYPTENPKNMVINIVAKDQSDIKRIVKPFYWKYPAFKWVSFKELRGLPETTFAKELRENLATIVCDNDGSIVYSALEAMKSGSIVFCKTLKNDPEWTQKDGKYVNGCIWYDDFDMLHKQIASVVRSFTTDKLPSVLYDTAKDVVKAYTMKNTKNQILSYVGDVLEKRKNEMAELLAQIKSNAEKK
jgi:hypothetical protein